MRKQTLGYLRGLGFIMPGGLTTALMTHTATASQTAEQHAQTAARLARDAKTPEELQRAKNVLEMSAMRQAMGSKLPSWAVPVGIAAVLGGFLLLRPR